MGIGRALSRRLYGSRADSHEAFEGFLVRRTPPGAVVLDCGCGTGYRFPEKLRRTASKVCGIDPDPAAKANPHLDEVRICPAERISYPDGTFDIVFAKYVLEHLGSPVAALREVRRVLKPGGRFVFLTPNAFHYATLVSLGTPAWFHRFVNGLRGRRARDTFPTFYRANTKRRVASLCEGSGLALAEVLFHEPRPAYLEPFWPLFLLGAGYERLVGRSDRLSALRFNIMGAASRA